MRREWKPGDVAVIQQGSLRVAFIRGQKSWNGVDNEGGRYTDRGEPNWAGAMVRPLVVIDPEDKEAAYRAGLAFQKVFDDIPYESDDLTVEFTNAAQAALREFADPKPPKPEEPTGLGAVVEDARGDCWVRVETGAWRRDGYTFRSYDAIAEQVGVVRVLSEGVQP